MKIATKRMTCSACPSQWEGKLTDGRMFYVRYRWGCLEVWLSEKPCDDVMQCFDGTMIVDKCLGDSLDGVIDWDDVVPHLKLAGVRV